MKRPPVLRVVFAVLGVCLACPSLSAAERKMFSGGIVQPAAEVTIRSKIRGEIKSLPVREGDRVQKGTLIAEMDNEVRRIVLEQAKNQLKSKVAVEKAEALLELAQIELRRQEDLGAQNLVSQRELDRARVSLHVAQIDLQTEKERKVKEALDVDRYEKELKDTRLSTPVAGYVVRILKHQGEVVEELEPIAQIVDIDEAHAQFDLPIEQLERLDLGTKASIHVQATAGGPFEGEVTFIAPTVEPRSKTLRIKVTIKNPKHAIKPGLSASVTFEK